MSTPHIFWAQSKGGSYQEYVLMAYLWSTKSVLFYKVPVLYFCTKRVLHSTFKASVCIKVINMPLAKSPQPPQFTRMMHKEGEGHSCQRVITVTPVTKGENH